MGVGRTRFFVGMWFFLANGLVEGYISLTLGMKRQTSQIPRAFTLRLWQ